MPIKTGGLRNGGPRRLRSLVAWVALSIVAAVPASAQSISGDLVVRVVDPSDLSVPGAAVTLTEVETGVMQSAVTDAQGTYGSNSIATPLTVNNYDQYNVRLDHHLGPRDQLFGTFSYADEARDVKVLRPFGGEGFPLSNRLVTITHAHTFTPNLLNEFRFGYNRSKTYRLAETSYGPDYAREVFNLENTTDQAIRFGIPGRRVEGPAALAGKGTVRFTYVAQASRPARRVAVDWKA